MLALSARRSLAIALAAAVTVFAACTTDREVGGGGECVAERDVRTSCVADSDCDDLGASCIDRQCMCPEWFCNAPAQTLSCTSNADCGNYPGTSCSPDGVCACPTG